jgi:hypothetical protein
MAKKYKEYYYTTRKMDEGYVWRIRNKDGEILQCSQEPEEFFSTRSEAESSAQEHIDDYWDN